MWKRTFDRKEMWEKWVRHSYAGSCGRGCPTVTLCWPPQEKVSPTTTTVLHSSTVREDRHFGNLGTRISTEPKICFSLSFLGVSVGPELLSAQEERSSANSPGCMNAWALFQPALTHTPWGEHSSRAFLVLAFRDCLSSRCYFLTELGSNKEEDIPVTDFNWALPAWKVSTSKIVFRLEPMLSDFRVNEAAWFSLHLSKTGAFLNNLVLWKLLFLCSYLKV